MGAYDEDLAYIHHHGFGHFARGAAPGMIALLQKAGITGGRICDLGCGSGILARAFTDAGYEVEGLDFSPAMVRLAKKNAPAARFRRGSFLDFDLRDLQAVTATGEVFNYVFDERNRKKALPKLLRSIHTSLAPGGMLLFDVAGKRRVPDADTLFYDEKDYSLVVRRTHDRKRNELAREITIFRKHGKQFRKSREEHVQRLYEPGQVAEMLRDAGFRVRHLRGYGSFILPPGLAGFAARKE